jgi:selenocysteine-specific elongation factor
LKQIILGTSGHIDHGKTSLIKALTGTDTDRLKEEKLRGITIELGFASLTLPDGQHIGIIDVPGHEKFVKNMVAGASGIDIVAMIIAADEGVMPQTREHMEICSLLGIKQGLIILTKIDIVDEELKELAIEDVEDFVQGTFLENSPIIPVSSITEEGIDELLKILENICRKTKERPFINNFRLPVDRVFTMKGFGTVITGTIISGSVNVGETIEIYPSCIKAKVRGIQVHNKAADIAKSGMRTAINFQGIEKELIQRGDIIAQKGLLKPSYILDVKFNYLKSVEKPLKTRSRVRFHTGTLETIGLLVLIDKEKLLPGEATIAQIRLDMPVACIKDDRFVIRSYSPIRAIGGGRILNPIAKKHKASEIEEIKRLKEITEDNPEEIIEFHIKNSGNKGLFFSELIILSNLTAKKLDSFLQKLLSKEIIFLTDKENKNYIHKETVNRLSEKALKYLEIFHKKNPLKSGISKEELKSKLFFYIDPKISALILKRLEKQKVIAVEDSLIRLFSHSVLLKKDQKEFKENIIKKYKKAGLTPAYFKNIITELNINEKEAKDVLKLLLNEKTLIKVKQDLYFHNEAVSDLKQKIINFFKNNEEMTAPDFKDIAQVSRKYLIPLLEYFDSANITIRVGDIRKVRR